MNADVIYEAHVDHDVRRSYPFAGTGETHRAVFASTLGQLSRPGVGWRRRDRLARLAVLDQAEGLLPPIVRDGRFGAHAVVFHRCVAAVVNRDGRVGRAMLAADAAELYLWSASRGVYGWLDPRMPRPTTEPIETAEAALAS